MRVSEDAATPRRHLIVCGGNPLAHRLVEELTTRYGEEVTVIVRSLARRHARQISLLPGVRVVEAEEFDDDAFQAAGIEGAQAVAVVGSEDVDNIHAALRAQELNPDLRLVVRIFNTDLGGRIRSLFRDCAMLSVSAMAAPSFVAAALGEMSPRHVRLPGRTFRVTSRDDVLPHQVVCGLADTMSTMVPRLLPPDQENADLVLAAADGAAQERVAGRPHAAWLRTVWDALRAPVNWQLRVALTTVAALLVLGTVLLGTAGRYTWYQAIYLTLLDAAGAANPDLRATAVNKVIQVMVTLVGISVIPVVTAAVVDAVVGARIVGVAPRPPRRISDHVVVVGLGHVGTRVMLQLRDLGVPVVCVEKSLDAVGVSQARSNGVPVVAGDATRDDTLHRAGVATCRAVVAVTSDDVANLEAVLHAREIRPDLPVVLRLFDHDLAARVERSFGAAVSRSVSFLAAPAFAAAMVERQVIGTIPVGRQVLLVADVPVGAGSELDGRAAETVHECGEVRVIGLRRHGEHKISWSPHLGYVLAADDRLIVLATRGGLSQVLTRSITQPV